MTRSRSRPKYEGHKSRRTLQGQTFDHARFIKELLELFPRIAEEIDPSIEGGLLHLEMAAFRRFAEDEIDSHDRERVVRCFQFLERLLVHGDENVKNAVYVSFLEHLPHEDKSKEWAWALLHSTLKTAWIEITDYNDRMHRTNNMAIVRQVIEANRRKHKSR